MDLRANIRSSALEFEKFPEPYRVDIARAVGILKGGGCREVHVFGSVAQGTAQSGSDLDLGVRGCPPDQFFPLLGKLLMELEHSVDLVNLDRASRLTDLLRKHGTLVYAG